jgi:putative transcriptional regulator
MKPTTKTLPPSTQLKQWRERMGLSQSQAAPVLGVTLDTLQNWEQGRRTPRGLALTALLERIKSK